MLKFTIKPNPIGKIPYLYAIFVLTNVPLITVMLLTGTESVIGLQDCHKSNGQYI